MLRVVTTNNAEVFRHLGTGAFQRLDVEHHVATTYDEALEQVHTHHPKLAIIDVDLAGGSGYELCKRIKADPKLADVHVMMVLSSVISREVLEHLDACGCDDVLAVPLHSDDFYHHIAQIAGLPLRRERRMDVALEVSIPGSDQPLSGTVDNISGGGAGVLLNGPLEEGQAVTARMIHDGVTYPDVPATVAWVRPPAGEVYSAGLQFEDLPIKTRLLMERLCLYEIHRVEGGPTTVSLYGDFTEITDFTALAADIEGDESIDFYMRAVRYISSAGVRSWCNFLGVLGNKGYQFRHCSMAFVSQAAMVPLSVGTGSVVSLEAPYRCETCDRDDLRLLERNALLLDGDHIVPPTLKCGECGDDLEFDDVPDRYFAFLRPLAY